MEPTRPTALSTNGVVATPHYLASQAGLRILQEGGSAVDAAVAANAVLQVVYPHNCSLGGDAFWIIYDPHAQRLRRHRSRACRKDVNALSRRSHRL